MYKENNKNEISSYNDNSLRSASVIQGYDLRLAFFTIDWFLKSYNVWRAYCWLTNNLIGVKYKGICMTASKRLNVIVPEQLLCNDQYIDCDV